MLQIVIDLHKALAFALFVLSLYDAFIGNNPESATYLLLLAGYIKWRIRKYD